MQPVLRQREIRRDTERHDHDLHHRADRQQPVAGPVGDGIADRRALHDLLQPKIATCNAVD
jgi:hypothetical protein